MLNAIDFSSLYFWFTLRYNGYFVHWFVVVLFSQKNSLYLISLLHSFHSLTFSVNYLAVVLNSLKLFFIRYFSHYSHLNRMEKIRLENVHRCALRYCGFGKSQATERIAWKMVFVWFSLCAWFKDISKALFLLFFADYLLALNGIYDVCTQSLCISRIAKKKNNFYFDWLITSQAHSFEKII